MDCWSSSYGTIKVQEYRLLCLDTYGSGFHSPCFPASERIRDVMRLSVLHFRWFCIISNFFLLRLGHENPSLTYFFHVDFGLLMGCQTRFSFVKVYSKPGFKLPPNHLMIGSEWKTSTETIRHSTWINLWALQTSESWPIKTFCLVTPPINVCQDMGI